MRVIHFVLRELAVSVLMLLSSVALAQAEETSKGESEVIFQTGMGAEIPAREMASVENDALSGSVSAAIKLVAFARFVTGDRSKELYWSRISYENGNKDAALSIGILLSYSSDQSDMRRARFWLKKAISEGSPDAAMSAQDRLVSIGDIIDEKK